MLWPIWGPRLHYRLVAGDARSLLTPSHERICTLKVSATSSNSGNSVDAKREDERDVTEDLLLHRMMMMTGCNHASSGS